LAGFMKILHLTAIVVTSALSLTTANALPDLGRETGKFIRQEQPAPKGVRTFEPAKLPVAKGSDNTKVSMAVPLHPGDGNLAMGVPLRPGNGILAMGVPLRPGNGILAMGVPLRPGNGILAMGVPLHPSNGILAMGVPLRPNNGIFAMGIPLRPPTAF
jgi:hypothetical protein